MLVKEYEKQGGGYKKSEKDAAAKSLEEWSEQDWQTETGNDRAREDGVTKRYLPKAVWEKLSDAEKQEAEQIKEEASKKGEQHVEWTPAIKKAIHEVEHKSDNEPSKQELYEQAKSLDIKNRSKMSKEELTQAIDQAQS
ncbi:Rho termination factor N-terminal domain-containing protein [Nostoc sp. FACHB-152]|uniref:Rho termination factor N-terminal domain-containing protein n=1 Tax=Nostoc sp. FACHB-152 TaxID=2692837 RepID=UPI0037C4F8ED